MFLKSPLFIDSEHVLQAWFNFVQAQTKLCFIDCIMALFGKLVYE